MISKMDETAINTFDAEPEYKQLVLDAFNNERSFFIPNRTLNHAKLLVYLLFKKAKKSIKIFSGNLNSNIYEDAEIKKALLDSLRINKNLTLDVITEGKIDSTNLETDLRTEFSSRVTFKIVKPTKVNHFILVDESSFRIESIHENNKKHEFIGKANFNDTILGSSINRMFEHIQHPN